MNDNRKGGLALIIGAIAELIVMVVHPQGQQIAMSETVLFLNGIVHTVAILAMPILFVGALGLTRAINKPDRLAVLAVAFYTLGLVAGVCAASISGYVTPNIIHRIGEAAAVDADFWRKAARLSWWMNQGFARILAISSGVAIALWSVTMNRHALFSRSLAIYGIIIGVLIVFAVGSGHIQLDIHGFGAVTLLETIWLVLSGAALMRLRTE